MKVTIHPSTARGTVMAPPSKSLAHRALICGALSETSTIRNIAYSQDIEATLRCLEVMGAFVRKGEDSVTLGGLNPRQIPPYTVLNCGESGSTLRFLLPLCLLSESPILLTGSQRLLERPLEAYEEICRQQNLTYLRTDNAITVCGRLSAGEYCVRGDVSSQFITGLMLALAFLDQDSVIDIITPCESRSYMRMTQQLQKRFGVETSLEKAKVTVNAKQTYRSHEYTVEGDWSNASFLDAFNLLNGDVKVMGLSGEITQGDRVFTTFRQQLASGVREFDLSDCPDLGPVMFALAAVLGGGRFTGIRRLRFKESDRIASMTAELKKFGIVCNAEENAVTIHGTFSAPSVALCGYNDHRIVMALTLLCSLVGGEIIGAEAVAKSYPNYFEVLRSLGIKVIEE